MLTPPGLGPLGWSRPHPGPQPHVGAVQASPRSPGGPGDQGSRLCHVRAAPESGKGRHCPSPQPSPEGLLPREGAWEEAGLRHPGLRPALLPGLERGFQARVTCGTLHLTTGQRGGFSCRSLGERPPHTRLGAQRGHRGLRAAAVRTPAVLGAQLASCQGISIRRPFPRRRGGSWPRPYFCTLTPHVVLFLPSPPPKPGQVQKAGASCLGSVCSTAAPPQQMTPPTVPSLEERVEPGAGTSVPAPCCAVAISE